MRSLQGIGEIPQRQWHVARSTVVIAFEQLRAEGYVHGTVGAGTVVAATLPEDLLQVRICQAGAPAPYSSPAVLSQRGQRLVTSPFPRDAPVDISHPFRTGQPALDVFPRTLWSRLAARVQRQASCLLFAHGDARGYAPLREAIAAYLGVVLPPRLVDAFVAAHSLVDRYAPVLDQAVLATFMSEGHFARHIRRMRTLYAERLQAFVTATHATCDDLLHVVDVAAGLDTIGWLLDGLDAQHTTTLAAARGLEVRPLSAYVLQRSQPPGLVLGFATVPAHSTPQAVQRLAQVLRAARRQKMG